MAEIINLDAKKEANRRLALLALTGDRPGFHGTCPDAERLACLVEGRLNPEEVETCQAHLADCEPCYALWRQLDRDWQLRTAAKPRGRILQLLHRPGFLTATGSLLALAASITLFFTLTTQVDRTALVHFSTQPLREQVQTIPSSKPETSATPSSKPLAAPIAESVEGTEKKAPPARAHRDRSREGGNAAPAMKSKRSANRDSAAKQSTLQTMRFLSQPQNEIAAADALTEKKEQSVPLFGAKDFPPSHQPHKAIGMTSRRSEEHVGSGPPALLDWQGNIRLACQGPAAPDFFTDLTVQGKQLIAQEATSPLTQKELQQIKAMLTIMDDQRQTAEHRCQALLKLLNPAERGDGK